MISGDRTVKVPELCSCQRRLSLVYCYVQGGYDAVVVSSEDTDVFVCLWPFLVPLMPVCSRNEVLRQPITNRDMPYRN